MSTNEDISFVVNGSKVSSDADPETPLLYILRNDLKLKGTRFGCGDGLCGACTVLVDGVATLSCDTPLHTVTNKSVRTIEGVLSADSNPIVQRMMETHAWQCGYCTAGIIMKAVEILDPVSEDTVTTRTELARALDANLCRCGAHPRILDALEPLLNAESSNQNDTG